MVEIKGWKRVKNIVDDVVGERIWKNLKNGCYLVVIHPEPNLVDNWKIVYTCDDFKTYYKVPFYTKQFMKRNEALKKSMDYMRSHPNGLQRNKLNPRKRYYQN